MNAYAALVAMGLTAAALLAGCGKSDAHGAAGGGAAPPERPPVMVNAVEAIAQDVPVYLEEIGRTVSVDEVSIVPQVGGKIIATHVEDGAEVKQGQLLFEIDPRPFQAALAAAQAGLAQSKAELELARIEFRRAEDLIKQNAISQLEYDQSKSDVDVAVAKVDAAQAQLEVAQLDLEYTKIASPIDGRAGQRLVHAGNVVRANGEPMLNVQRLDPIYAEFTVTENDLGTVRKYIATRGLDSSLAEGKGLKVYVDVPGDSARVLGALGAPDPATQPSANRAGPREGALTFLNNAVTDGSGTVRLRALLPNPDRYFWPGQFVNVRLVLTTKRGAVLIPTQAQQIGQKGPYVYVVAPDGTAEMRQVAPGQRHGDRVVVDTGVQPGERVVTVGHMMIQPGGKVQVAPQPGAAPGQPGQANASPDQGAAAGRS